MSFQLALKSVIIVVVVLRQETHQEMR